MRGRIVLKLAAIWLAVAVPLSGVLAYSYYQWYQTRLSLVEQQRLGYAQLAGTSFSLLITDIERTMNVAGSSISVPGTSRASATLALRRVANLYPVDYVVLADLDGRVLQASEPRLVGTDLSGHDSFRLALSRASGHGIEPSDDEGYGVVGFHVAQRIGPSASEPVGVMLALVDVRKLHRAFPVGVAAGGINVVDSAGQVVFQNEDPRFAIIRDDWGDRFDFVRRALDGETVPTKGFEFPLKGRRIGGFVPIASLGWAAGSSVDTGPSLSPFFRNLGLALPITLVIGAVALIVSAGISRSITHSLRGLAADAERIGAGDLSKPVRTERGDEIGDVARSLEEARRSLDDYVQENALLFERQREAAEFDRALSDVDSILHSTLDFREILSRVLEVSAEAMGCEAAGINLHEGEYWVRAALVGLPKEFVGERLTDDENTVAALVGATGEPAIIEDAEADDRVLPWFTERYGIKSLLVLPLVVRGVVVGVVFFDYLSAPTRFTDAQVDFATRLSFSLSLAHENARLYSAAHDIAETLQTALLALPASMPGVEFAHAYRSSTETARVGGDFYDLFGIDAQRVGLTIGDMSGHGVEAAVLTSLVKYAIRTAASERDLSPADVLARANRMLFQDSPEEVFSTVFFGVLDLADGRLTYCNAAHTTVACIPAEGSIVRLPVTSPLVGAFPDIEFEDSEASLGVRDMLFLYTDGLTEARREGELYGEERLFGLLDDHRDGDIDRAVRDVTEDVLSFAGGSLSDDFAVLALRRTPA